MQAIETARALLRQALCILSAPAATPEPANDSAAEFVATCHRIDGALTDLKTLTVAFCHWIISNRKPYQSQRQLIDAIRAAGFPYGVGNRNVRFIGNLSLSPDVEIGLPVEQRGPRVYVPRPPRQPRPPRPPRASKPRQPRSPEAKRLAQARRTLTTMGQQGYKLAYIADHLNGRGYFDPDGKEWNVATVSRELRRQR